jgi:hypothetical protein
MTDRTYPITVMPRPSGVALDAEPYAADLLRDVIGLLADKPTLMDDLVDLVCGEPEAHDPYLPDRPSREDRFIAAVLTSLPEPAKEIRVHGPALSRIAGMLTSISGQQARRDVTELPQQRDGRAA